ncbi:MAG: NfeD family protein [Gammaproteobacteria bacterium]|nr:NfeD family protein [Gammaproteobacteria bacterium]
MEWLANNLAYLLIFAGLALLAIEVVVLGFSVMVLFFIGLGCLVTGILIFIGILPSTLVSVFTGVAVLSLLSAVALWKPLKKMQDEVIKTDVKGDLIGYSFVLDTDISSQEPGAHKYSGIEWKVKSESPLSAGTEVEVVRTDVGEFKVAAKT